MPDPRSVTVNVFGQEYTLRGDAEPEYVQSVARLVDEKMREIAENAKLGSTAKVAILAAINLADELLRERQKHRDALRMLDDRTSQIASLLDNEMAKVEGRGKG